MALDTLSCARLPAMTERQRYITVLPNLYVIKVPSQHFSPTRKEVMWRRR